MLSESAARSVLERAHSEWSRRSVEGLLSLYADDLAFWCNAGDPEGGPISIHGKPAFRDALDSFLRIATCRSCVVSFAYDGRVGRAAAHHRIQHLASGLVLQGTFRQIVNFDGKRITRLEEYHDAARLSAYWKAASDGRISSGLIGQESH